MKSNFPAKTSSEKQIRWFSFWQKFWLENLFSILTDLYMISLQLWIRTSIFHCISYLRYGDTWGDWHGGNSGSPVSFETVLIGSNGVIGNSGWYNGFLFGISFRGNNGTIYGPFGGTEGEVWESNIPSGNSVSYISGRSGSRNSPDDRIIAISFHHSSKNQGRYPAGRGVSEKVSTVGFCLGSGLFGSCNSDQRLLAKSWNHIVIKPFFHIIGTYWFIKYIERFFKELIINHHNLFFTCYLSIAVLKKL